MATKEELFAAVLTLKHHCAEQGSCIFPQRCLLRNVCMSDALLNGDRIEAWPDPEEGGGEDG